MSAPKRRRIAGGASGAVAAAAAGREAAAAAGVAAQAVQLPLVLGALFAQFCVVDQAMGFLASQRGGAHTVGSILALASSLARAVPGTAAVTLEALRRMLALCPGLFAVSVTGRAACVTEEHVSLARPAAGRRTVDRRGLFRAAVLALASDGSDLPGPLPWSAVAALDSSAHLAGVGSCLRISGAVFVCVCTHVTATMFCSRCGARAPSASDV